MRRGLAGGLLAAGLLLDASTPAAEPMTLDARGSLQVAFTPGDDAGALVIEAIARARRQILVQAYSLTHRAIADALLAAWRRGVDVQVIADMTQAQVLATSRVQEIAMRGVPVWLDGEHAAAHNKVMVIDPELDTATVITGSFNFTHAAQHRNAENLLVLRGQSRLAQAYAANWRRHRAHALKLRQ